MPMGDESFSLNYGNEFFRELSQISFSEQEIKEIKQNIISNVQEDAQEKDSFISDMANLMDGKDFNSLLSSAYDAVRRISGKKICGIKEIWCSDFINTIISQNIKCVQITRDPRGIICSRNCGNYLRKSCGNIKYPVLFIARAWRTAIHCMEKLAGNESFINVKYEELLENPELTIKNLCSFLRINFSASALAYENFSVEGKRPWKGNADTEEFSGIEKSRAERWKNELGKDEIFLCEFLCGKEMETMGYELTSDAKNVERFMNLKEDPQAEKSWLAEYGHTLTEEQKRKELSRLETVYG